MSSIDEVKIILGSVLGIGDRAKELTKDSVLLGGLPEFDSMAVVSVLTSIEEQYGVVIEDDDISAETFASVGSLAKYLDSIID